MVDTPTPNQATPSERRLQAQAAAHISWANASDRAARTANARAALDRTFLDAADGDPLRAAHLRAAHFAKLALRSAQARRKAKEAQAEIEAVDAELETAGGHDDAA